MNHWQAIASWKGRGSMIGSSVPDRLKMETISCIFCHRESDLVVIEENGYTGRKCCSCGLVYLSPRPAEEAIAHLYVHNQAFVSAQSHLSNQPIKKVYAKHTLALLKKHVQKGSLLELGAGAGCFLHEARESGFDSYGIDPNPILTNFMRESLNIPCEDKPLSLSSFGTKTFDVIYHCDVISHFYDPVEAFQKIFHKLNENGILLFETGNFGDVDEKYYAHYSAFQYPDHLFFFGEQNLKNLLDMTGFEVINIYGYSIQIQLLVLKFLRQISLATRKVKFKIARLRSMIDGGNSFGFYGKNRGGFFAKLPFGSGWLLRWRQALFAYFLYILRYYVGYIIPKKRRPQTIIVIAQKKNCAQKRI